MDQFAAVGQSVRLINLLTHEKLDTIPCGSIYERLLNSGIPLSHVPDLGVVQLWLMRAARLYVDYQQDGLSDGTAILSIDWNQMTEDNQ